MIKLNITLFSLFKVSKFYAFLHAHIYNLLYLFYTLSSMMLTLDSDQVTAFITTDLFIPTPMCHSTYYNFIKTYAYLILLQINSENFTS